MQSPHAASSGSGASLPTRIGRFEIHSPLGQGGFGKVYRARDPQLGRDVAVKVAQPGTRDDPRQLQRFLREAQSAAGLHHPNIVPVLDAGVDQRLHYIASAFIEGPTLAERLEQGRMPLAEAVHVIQMLAEALDYAHREGVVHRDVKPANVLLDRTGQPHLLDFGLAYRIEQDAGLTHDGEVLGTPAYLAPELATGRIGEPLPASDQYSLGVILFEMICGRLPFENLAAKLAGLPPRPRRFNRRIPKALETICLKTLAPRPDQRYASCQELANDLRRFRSHQPIRARQPGWLERLWLWRQREPALAWSAVTAGLALLAVAVVPVVAYFLVAVSLSRLETAREKFAAQTLAADQETKQLEQQKQKAEEAAGNATTAAQQAKVERDKARLAGEEAQKKTEQAKEALAEVAHREVRRQRYQYVADVNLALIELQDHDLPGLKTRLDRLAPRDGQEKPALEWFLLDRMRQAEPRRLDSAKFSVQALYFNHPGSRSLAILGRETGTDPFQAVQWATNQVTGEPEAAGSRNLSVPGKGNGQLPSTNGPFLFEAKGSMKTEVTDGRTDRKWTLTNHPFHLRNVLVSAQGDFLASVHDRPATIKLWQGNPPQVAASLDVDAETLAFSWDSRILAAGIKPLLGKGPEIKVWTLPKPTEALTLIGHPTGSVRLLEFGPDGLTLTSAGGRGVIVWDLATRKPRFSWELAGCRSLHYAADSKHLLVLLERSLGGPEGNARLYNLTTGKAVPLALGERWLAQSASFSADGQFLALGGQDEAVVTLWSVVTGKRFGSLPVSDKQVAVAFSGVGKSLAAAGRDGVVQVWSGARVRATHDR